MRMAQSYLDVLVIGGGQAGLAAGYELKRRGRTALILDANERVGDSWRNRYDSLTLFTPRRFSALAGLALPGAAEGYASKDEFADYLVTYARTFEFDIRHGVRIVNLRAEGGGFVATADSGERFTARSVVVANGAFQQPAVPSLAHQFDAGVLQLSASSYRNPGQLGSAGTVLVVGDGASGRDIAVELSASRKVLLARGRRRKLLPERIFGRSIWDWLNLTGLSRVPARSLPGRIMRRADPFPDRDRGNASLAARGIALKPRLAGAAGSMARFADGTAAPIDAVIWSAGYLEDTGWIEVPGALSETGQVLHDRGLSPVPGLYYLGRPWQRNRGSALVMGVSADAAFVADAMQSVPSRREVQLAVA